MEEGKEPYRKYSSDVHSGRNVSVSKGSYFKNASHLPFKSETNRKRFPYISRAKNLSIPVEKKYGFYRSNASSFTNHSCDKCGIKGEPHFLVNATAATSLTDVPKFDPDQDYNANASFSTHSALCNFTASVSEISRYNQVLSFQTNPHYDISIPKSISHKQRTAYTDHHRTYVPKIINSPNSYTTSRFYSAIPNSNIRYHCSKNVPNKFASSESYFKIPDRIPRENIAITEKYTKYVKYTLPDSSLMKDNSVKYNKLPLFETSSFSKSPSMTCKVDYSDDQLKQRNFSSKKWNTLPVSKKIKESSKGLDETDKMLFPALPSNRNQQSKGSCSSVNILSQNSLAEKSVSEEGHLPDSSLCSLIVCSSATSTVSQVSYADVMRLSETSSGMQGCVTLDYAESKNPKISQSSHQSGFSVDEKQPNDVYPLTGSPDFIVSRLSQVDLNVLDSVNTISSTSSNENEQNFIASRPIVVSLEKPSFYNSSLQTCKSVLSALSSSSLPDKKVMEEYEAVDYLTTLEKISSENSLLESTNRSSVSSEFAASVTDTHAASIKTDSLYSSPSSVSSLGDAFKPTENRDHIIDNILNKVVPPVIIMNHCYSDSLTEISFGIEHNEMLQLCSNNKEGIVPLAEASADNLCHDKKFIIDRLQLNTSSLPAIAPVPLQPEVETVSCSIISVKGRNLHWKDKEIDYNASNYLQLTEYFSEVWEDIENEYKRGLSNGKKNVHYFKEL
ncbi:hypothetical protein JTE90_007964 [Oedothorax gibbosus]|uniref:Uncharacterized protein n=1 Tax=Oedothorax gibbosus TaxID=931172 RepID=A0AAV6U8N0_9ARAC|nr:hypothetical protein JTE90_007964 [Oedothorax gibbosus]